MKRYVIVGELIEEENGFLMEYSAFLRILKMAMTTKDSQYQELKNQQNCISMQSQNKSLIIKVLQEEIKKWKNFTYLAIGIATIFLIIII